MSSSSTAARSFQPVCQSCQYCLAGLPDGLCPECGTAFTHAELALMDAQRPTLKRLIARWIVLLMVVIMISVTSGYFVVSLGLFMGTFFAAGAFCIFVVSSDWDSIRRRPQRLARASISLIVLCPPVVCTLTIPYEIVLALVLPLILLLIGAYFAPGTVCVACALVIFSTLCLYAGHVAYQGELALQQGMTWSSIPDPRPGQIHRQYPLTAREATYAGYAVLLGSTAALLVVIQWAHRHAGTLWAEWRREYGPAANVA